MTARRLCHWDLVKMMVVGCVYPNGQFISVQWLALRQIEETSFHGTTSDSCSLDFSSFLMFVHFPNIIMALQKKLLICPFCMPDKMKARASALYSSCWHFISSHLNYCNLIFSTLKHYLVQHGQQCLLCPVLSWSGLYTGSGMLIEGHKGAYWTFTFSLQQNLYIACVDIKLVHCLAAESCLHFIALYFFFF